MDEREEDIVVPVFAEELHADAIPVETGGVRVTKRVETHEEILAQELRKTHVDVKRIKTDRIVDGPQAVRRAGNTLIIPVVSEVLRIQKQWVVTEEIHITEIEERNMVEQRVEVRREVPQIERLDAHGDVVAQEEAIAEDAAVQENAAAAVASVASSPEFQSTPAPTLESGLSAPSSLVAPKDPSAPSKRKVLSGSRSILRK